MSHLILEYWKIILPSKLSNVEELYKKLQNNDVKRNEIPTGFVTRILKDYLVGEDPELIGRNEVLQRLSALRYKNGKIEQTISPAKTKNAKPIRLLIDTADSEEFKHQKNFVNLKKKQLYISGDYFADDETKEVVNLLINS